MNEMLQQRIEEARKNYENSLALPDWDRKEIHGIDFMKGATFALQNQWISVEEALPELDNHGYSKPVLVTSDINELLVATYSKNYDRWNAVGPVSYHRLVVTHWMEIPSLEGGEK